MERSCQLAAERDVRGLRASRAWLPGGRAFPARFGGRLLQNTEQCEGPRVTYSYGGSATAAAILGLNAGASVNIGVPTNISWRNPLTGVQLSFSAQGGVMAGYGIFVGAGTQHQVGYSTGPAEPGLSSSYFVQADAGVGPAAIGGSIQANRPLGSGVAGAVGGKIGVGGGLFVGAGKQGQATFAFKPLGY